MEVLGIDIGGTKIYCAKINEKGEIIGEVLKNKTPQNGPEDQNGKNNGDNNKKANLFDLLI